MKHIYRNRLAEHLIQVPISNDIDKEWNNIRTCIEKAAIEAIRKKKRIRNKKGLRVWNEELLIAINEKQKAYIEFLQKNTQQARDLFTYKRNYSKQLTRKVHRDSWGKFISDIEHNVHGRQSFAYKVMRHLNRTEKDVPKLIIIKKVQWIGHYKELWCKQKEEQNSNPNLNDEGEIMDVDEISIVNYKMH